MKMTVLLASVLLGLTLTEDFYVEIVRNVEFPFGSQTTNDIYYPYERCDSNGCYPLEVNESFPGVIFMPGTMIPKKN
jgi:hypothetical protein